MFLFFAILTGFGHAGDLIDTINDTYARFLDAKAKGPTFAKVWIPFG